MLYWALMFLVIAILAGLLRFRSNRVCGCRNRKNPVLALPDLLCGEPDHTPRAQSVKMLWQGHRGEQRGSLTGMNAAHGTGNLNLTILNIPKGGTIMKPSTKDQMKGKFHEVKGTVKEKAGKAVNDPDLEVEGADEKTAGKIQKKIGQVEKVLEK